jgi:hypothetical protein
MQLCKGKRRLTDQGWRHAKKNCLPHEGRFLLAFHALHIHLHPFSCLLQPQMKNEYGNSIHQLHCQLVTEVWRHGNLVCEQPSRNLAWQKLEILHNNNQQNCLAKRLRCAKRLDFKHYQETENKIVYSSLRPLQLRKAESANSSVMTIRFADRWFLS